MPSQPAQRQVETLCLAILRTKSSKLRAYHYKRLIPLSGNLNFPPRVSASASFQLRIERNLPPLVSKLPPSVKGLTALTSSQFLLNTSPCCHDLGIKHLRIT